MMHNENLGDGKKMVDQGIDKEFISAEEIALTVARLGREINDYYSKKPDLNLLVIGLLRGSFVFMADLIRQIELPLTVDFMTVSSYGNGINSTGNVKDVMDLDEPVEGKDVLMVEDIIDTGNTFNKVLGLIRYRKPRSLKICTFLSKPSRRQVEVPIDFCGMEIPDEFVCGYGLDYAQKYRNLPYIGILKEDR